MSTTPEPSWPASAEDVVSTEDLGRRTGARPFTSLSDLPGTDPFGDDEEYNAILADLYATRRADVA